MSDPVRAVVVFLMSAGYDFLVVRYFQMVSDGRRFFAVIFSMVLGGVMLFSFLTVDDARWLAVPNILGYGLGTFAAMTWGKR